MKYNRYKWLPVWRPEDFVTATVGCVFRDFHYRHSRRAGMNKLFFLYENVKNFKNYFLKVPFKINLPSCSIFVRGREVTGVLFLHECSIAAVGTRNIEMPTHPNVINFLNSFPIKGTSWHQTFALKKVQRMNLIEKSGYALKSKITSRLNGITVTALMK